MTSVIVSAPSQWDCNFESGLCTWTQAKDDQFDWTRVQGGTGTTNTGPSSDHTTGSGYYIYIETSSPRRVNDTARIISQPINVNTTMCLNFWYHMYGTSVRTLNVYMKVGGSLSPPVWSRTGTRSNQWYSASVDVQSSTSYQIVFEGVRGTSYRGDIALDDISVSMGSCSSNHSYFSYCFFFLLWKCCLTIVLSLMNEKIERLKAILSKYCKTHWKNTWFCVWYFLQALPPLDCVRLRTGLTVDMYRTPVMISSGPGRAVGPPPQARDPPMTTPMEPLQVCTLNKWWCWRNTKYSTLIIKKKIHYPWWIDGLFRNTVVFIQFQWI